MLLQPFLQVARWLFTQREQNHLTAEARGHGTGQCGCRTPAWRRRRRAQRLEKRGECFAPPARRCRHARQRRRQPPLEDLLGLKILQAQVEIRRHLQGAPGYEANNFAAHHGDAIPFGFPANQLERPIDGVCSKSVRFIETWTIPRDFSSTPMALTNRRPPLEKRTARAIFCATVRSPVPRLTL